MQTAAKRPTITLAQYNEIHRDYRGTYEGRRSCFVGCIPALPWAPGLAIEGIDFDIAPAPAVRWSARR